MSCCGGKKGDRPLSPHVLIYKLPLSALLSISHRASGVLLYFAVVFLSGFSSFFILSEGARSCFEALVKSYGTCIGKSALLLMGFASIFHMVNGVKYILMDICVSPLFDKKVIPIVGSITLLCSLVLGGLFAFIVFGL